LTAFSVTATATAVAAPYLVLVSFSTSARAPVLVTALTVASLSAFSANGSG